MAPVEDGSTPLWRRLAALTVWLRWPIVVAWVLVAGAATSLAPATSSLGGGLDALLPSDSAPVQAEARTFREFSLPVLSRLAVVQRDPDGLPAATMERTLATAADLDARRAREGIADVPRDEIVAALPLVNSTRAIPSSTGDGTTAVTYLFGNPDASTSQQTRAARAYADRLGGAQADVVGVTGLIAAQREQGVVISDRLPLVEVATIAFVLLVVGVAFRSLVAPFVTVATALLAYLVNVRVLDLVGGVVDVTVPRQLEPLILALLIGVVADYSIFYMSTARDRLREGQAPRDAARGAAADYGRVILAAGITVAAGTASLVVARLDLYRAMGPALAVTVLTGLVVSLTLTPALMAVLGRALFWPSRVGAPARRDTPWVPHRRERRGLVVSAVTLRPVAALAVLLCVAGLAVAAAPARHLALDLSFAGGLPEDNSVRQAEVAAGQGFGAGIVSPTVVLLEAPGVAGEREALSRLQDGLDGVEGVAGTIGPGQLPATLTPEQAPGVLLSPGGDAARLLVVLDADPLGADAVTIVWRLGERLPAALADAGLPAGSATLVGDSAVAADLVQRTTDDFLRIGLGASGVLLVLLMVTLRAVVAPLFLLASSLLSVAAALGISTWVFQDLADRPGITFYVPFATTVLSLSLGSDYNVFSVGRVWEAARHRTLREALVLVTPRTNAAIRTAGIALAGSLALVALVPLWPFQEIALTMAVGLLLDVFVVRSVLVPSLITLFGPLSRWPGRLQPVPAGGRGGTAPAGAAGGPVRAARRTRR